MRWICVFDSKVAILLLAMVMMIGAVSTVSQAGEDQDPIETTSTEELNSEEELKNKTFYMYRVEDAVDVGGRTTKEMYNTTYPEETGSKTEESFFQVLVDWYLYPELAGDVTLGGSSTLNVWARASVDGGAELTYELYEVDPDGEEELIAEGEEERFIETEWGSHEIPIEIDEYTVSEGSSLKVTFDLWGDASTAYEIAYGGHIEEDENMMADTNVTLPTYDYLRVPGVHTEDHEGEVTNLFNPDAENKDISMHANITDPFGGYDIRWVNLTLVGPDGVIFDDHAMERTYGYFDSYISTYELPWDYTDQPEGTYEITVRAVDQNGMLAYEETGSFEGHEEYGEHSFVIGGLDHYVNIRLEDDHGEILEDTEVNLKVGADTTFSTDTTDEEGIVNFTVANATYEITVIWQDVEVETNRTLDVEEVGDRDSDDPFDLTAGIYYPTLEILDREDVSVQDANVYISHPNGTTAIEPIESDEEGEINLDRYAEGDYTFDIDWKGRNVGNIGLRMNDSGTFTLHVDVYHLDLTVEDREGDPVNNALVIASYDDTRIVSDSRLSDQNGEIDLRLPATGYLFEIIWNDADVGEETYELSESTEHTITADIFTVTVEVQDDLGEELPGAQVTATYERTDKEIATEETDEDGEAEFQLASGEHRFEVSWLEVDVAEESREVDEGATSFVIMTDVYQLDITPLDRTGDEGVLPDAEVSVYIGGSVVDTGRTDSQGVYTSQLPGTDYEVAVRWRGIEVYQGSYTIDDHDSIEPESDVYYLDGNIDDMEGQVLENAELRVEHQDDLITTGVTDEDGTVDFRLPEEDYSIEMRWRGFEVGETDVSIGSENEEMNETAAVYHLDFTAIDGRGTPLGGADIEMIFEGSTYTDGRGLDDGTLSARAPAVTFTLEVDWQGVQVYNEDVTVEGSEEIELESDVHYVTFSGLDSRENPVEDLVVSIYHGELPEGQDYLTTVDVGTDNETRVPGGEIEVVGEWRGFHVGEEDFNVGSDRELTFECEIYYLEIDLVDSERELLLGAELMVRDDKGVSFVTEIAEDGAAVPRLAPGEWQIEAFWRDEKVGETTVEITDEDSELTLETDVHDLEIVVEGEDGPIEGAELTLLKYGEPIMTDRTGENGNVTFSQIVEGEYEVVSRLKTTQHWTSIDMETTDEVSLQESEEHVMNFEGYPRPIYRTNLFYMVMVLVGVIVAGSIVLAKKKEVI